MSAYRKYASHMLGIVTINLYILLKYISPSSIKIFGKQNLMLSILLGRNFTEKT